MHLKKETGGMVGALYLSQKEHQIRVLAEGKIKPGDRLEWQDGHFFTVEDRDGKEATLTPSFPLTHLQELLKKYGETPLPPYIKKSPLTEEQRRNEYQTVFAHDNGSVAAPTAGLHFTKKLITKITQSGREVRYLTLHVNLGTFAPLTEVHWRDKKLHEERYDIDANTANFLNKAKQDGRPIIAVGTTTVRTLESATIEGTLQRLSGATDIFITEKDPLHLVDGLITNFHVPKSSLLMLVSAFTGRETLLELYKQAIEREYRFFSFGDGMMVL
jgi:S-adenosylmethionine:tRNA ribosyltransferase-isomerase